jgi:hypothetical protein
MLNGLKPNSNPSISVSETSSKSLSTADKKDKQKDPPTRTRSLINVKEVKNDDSSTKSSPLLPNRGGSDGEISPTIHRNGEKKTPQSKNKQLLHTNINPLKK